MGEKKISIDFIIPSYAAGGAERVTLSLAAGLTESRFERRLLVLNPTGPLSNAAIGFTEKVGFHGRRLQSAITDIVREIRTRRPLIVFSSQIHVNLALLVFRFCYSGSKLVVREANMPSQCLENGHWPKWYGWFYGVLFRRADLVIATSNAMANEMQSRFGLSQEQVAVIPNPVDQEAIRVLASALERKPGSGRRFIAVGRLEKQKGFDRLIDWMASNASDDHLTIVGEGSQRSGLENKIKASGNSGKIDLVGFRENPWKSIAGADVFLMPSRWEGLPNAALESLAVGTPVIATQESGGIEDIASSAPDGAVIVARSAEEFQEAMTAILPCQFEEIRSSLLPAKYTKETVSKNFETLLLNMIGKDL